MQRCAEDNLHLLMATAGIYCATLVGQAQAVDCQTPTVATVGVLLLNCLVLLLSSKLLMFAQLIYLLQPVIHHASHLLIVGWLKH